MLSVQIWSRTRAGEQQGDDWSRSREREEQEAAAVRIRSRAGEMRAGEREQGEQERAGRRLDQRSRRREEQEAATVRIRRECRHGSGETRARARSGGSESDGGRGGRDLARVQPDHWRNGGTVARLQEVAEHGNTAIVSAFPLVPALRR